MMKVRDVMTSDVVTIDVGATYKEAVEILLERDVSGLPVVDGHGRVIGIVTEADLLAKEAYAGRRRRALDALASLVAGERSGWVKAHGVTVGEMMTRDLVVARPEENVAVVARRMRAAHVKRVPVVEADGTLVGLLSRQDVLAVFSRPDEAIANDVRAILADPAYCPEDHDVHPVVYDGVVSLHGEVRHPSDRRVVEAAVSRVDGVVDVFDLLRAREPDPRLDRIVTMPR